MKHLYKGLVVIPLAFLLFLSCSNNKRNKIVILRPTDTLSFYLDAPAFVRNTYYYVNTKNEERYVHYNKYKKKLVFQDLFSTNSDTITLNNDIYLKYGISDFYVHSKDSIFIQPDNGNKTNVLILINQNGNKLNEWDITPIENSNYGFSASGFTFNRCKFYKGLFYSNRFVQGFKIQENGSFNNPKYYQYLHENIYNLETNEQYSCGDYPEKLKSNKYYGLLTLKTFKKDTVYWSFTHSPEILYSHSSNNYSSYETIDLNSSIDFNYKPLTKDDSKQSIMIEADMILGFEYDKFRKLFYITYTKAVDRVKPNGYTKNNIGDKPMILAVFDKNFNFINEIKLKEDDNYFFTEMIISEKGLLLKTKESKERNKEYYLFDIIYE